MTHTRRILWQVGSEITETKHAEREFYSILAKIQQKAPAIDAGNGVGFSWVQYRGHKKIEIDQGKCIIKYSIETKIYDNKEWKFLITEKIDKESKEVLAHDVEKKVVRVFSAEEIQRYKKWVEPLKQAALRRKHKSLR